MQRLENTHYIWTSCKPCFCDESGKQACHPDTCPTSNGKCNMTEVYQDMTARMAECFANTPPKVRCDLQDIMNEMTNKLKKCHPT